LDCSAIANCAEASPGIIYGCNELQSFCCYGKFGKDDEGAKRGESEFFAGIFVEIKIVTRKSKNCLVPPDKKCLHEKAKNDYMRKQKLLDPLR
jgi:hypothetical protein